MINTAEEKAREFVDMFLSQKVLVAIKQSSGVLKEYEQHMSVESAKLCALKCVGKIIEEITSESFRAIL